MNATEFKRFFKAQFGIPVLVQTSKHYISVRIKAERNGRDLVFSHKFPEELGRKCMGIVYAGHPTLPKQSWGGNIGTHDISMHRHEWDALLREYGYVIDQQA